MKKRIFYYAIFLVGLLFIAGTEVAQAAFSLPDLSKTSDLPAFISSVYSFALTVVGIAVFIRILYAGFLMLTAAGNSGKWGDAKNKMQNAVIGAILLFAAYLILFIINPDLVKNTFNFTIPSSSQPSSITPSIKTNDTSGVGAVNGIVNASGGATSFYGLAAVARAQEGIYPFTIKVIDRNGDTCSQAYNIEVFPLTAAVNADFYVKHSAAGKYSASLLNAVNAQEESGSEIIQTLQGGGCVIGTKTLPDAVENTPYYAEIVAAGEAPFVYEIEDGSLPDGLGLVAAMDMPVLTIKNMTAQRTPIYAFKVGDTFRLDLTGAKPNSDVYFKWFKNGDEWHYPDITPNGEGWAKYGTTDGSGGWVNQAVFTANEIGTWQEYAMVDGKTSRVIEFQVLDPTVKVVVSTPVPGATVLNVPVYGGGGGGGGGASSCQTEHYCENRATGEKSPILTDAQVAANNNSDRCPGMRQIYTCTYPPESSQQSTCDANQFATRGCYEQIGTVERPDGTINTSSLPHSTDGAPPTNVPAGSLYTVDQYAGATPLGGDNLLIKCRYSNQAQAVTCGNSMSGEYCTMDGRNAGFNESWCASKVDASGKPINPSPAPAPAGPTPIPASPATSVPTPSPRGGDSGSRGR